MRIGTGSVPNRLGADAAERGFDVGNFVPCGGFATGFPEDTVSCFSGTGVGFPSLNRRTPSLRSKRVNMEPCPF